VDQQHKRIRSGSAAQAHTKWISSTSAYEVDQQHIEAAQAHRSTSEAALEAQAKQHIELKDWTKKGSTFLNKL
jgi:hypothetical protein